MTAIRTLIIAISILVASYSQAAQTSCPEHYSGGQAPDLINQKLAAKTREVCYSGYGLMHSGITRTPLYSAEHLTRERLQKSRSMQRKSFYFPDPNIPSYERAELHHYARSGMSRGHIAPSREMPDEISQQESFSLANMVPQVAENNQGIWERVESAVRGMARNRGELYLVTGPISRGTASSGSAEPSWCRHNCSRQSMTRTGRKREHTSWTTRPMPDRSRFPLPNWRK